MYGAVGTGNVEPGIVTVSLGTSGTAYTFLREPFIDPTGEIAAFRDSTGHHLPLLCVSNLANGYDALREGLGISHKEFDELYDEGAPGSGGRLIVPWYVGERTPDLPQAAPFYFGFGPSDFRPEVLCRAMVEGHVLNLYDGFTRLPVTPTEIRLTGGLSNSPAWCQTIADVFRTDAVPVRGEGAALGAAIHAAWVWLREEGREVSLTEISSPFVVLEETARRSPDPAHGKHYEILRDLFRSLSRRIRGVAGEDPFLLRLKLLEL
jgi:xylulokinase